jgi:hypothetical protein
VSGTLTPFAPTATAPFQFQATLTDAALGTATYTCTALWNTAGQRWYLHVVDQNNSLIVNKPMVGSPPGYNISLVGGYFSGSTLMFLEASQSFWVTP